MKQTLLYDHYYDLAFKNNSPVSVMIELLTSCNLRCEHCYIPDYYDNGFSIEQIFKLLGQLREMGIQNVSFTGGEILVRKDIFEIIEYARKHYTRVSLLSNGTLSTESIAKRLKELHISEFSTTLFSMDHSIHDSITRKKGSWEALMNGLSMLKKYDIITKIKTPIMKKNVDGIQNIKDFCEKNDFEFLASPTIFNKNDGSSEPQNFCISDDKMISVIKFVDSLSNRNYLHNRNVSCAALFYSFSIDCNGNVYPCNSFMCKVGNVFETHPRDVWNNSEILQEIKSISDDKLGVCKNCEYKPECYRCPALVYMNNKDFYSCDEYSKKLSKIRMSDYKCI